jgi:hypothetical protein
MYVTHGIVAHLQCKLPNFFTGFTKTFTEIMLACWFTNNTQTYNRSFA